MENITFNVDAISNYLANYKYLLDELYTWEVDYSGLIKLGVINDSDINLNDSPYERGIVIKSRIRKKLIATSQYDINLYEKICLWIIKDWGGIKGAKDKNTKTLINNFLKDKDHLKFDRIASTSKIASFMYPKEYIIYDSRVAFSLNWIILSCGAGPFFFPLPEGRNSKMSAFDLNVLIRMSHIEKYQPSDLNSLDKHLFINAIDKTVFIAKKNAYTELNKLIKKVSKKLWKGNPEKQEKLFYTEMLLFSIADKQIFQDITNRISLTINPHTEQ